MTVVTLLMVAEIWAWIDEDVDQEDNYSADCARMFACSYRYMLVMTAFREKTKQSDPYVLYQQRSHSGGPEMRLESFQRDVTESVVSSKCTIPAQQILYVMPCGQWAVAYSVDFARNSWVANPLVRQMVVSPVEHNSASGNARAKQGCSTHSRL